MTIFLSCKADLRREKPNVVGIFVEPPHDPGKLELHRMRSEVCGVEWRVFLGSMSALRAEQF